MFLQLIRYRLSTMVAASALAGYVLYPAPLLAARAALLVTGVWLLAAGCSALNQVHERKTDALMERTRRRPVACGRLSPLHGTLIASGLLVAGVALLALTGKAAVVGLGLFAIFWYNGLYTGLKRISATAPLPGALCGAVPPLMGWAAAGGELSDYRIVLLAAVLVLWQLPHFWLLAIKYRDDFKKAGFPPLFPALSDAGIRRIVLVWIFATAAVTLLLGVFGILLGVEAKALCLTTVCWLIASTGWAMWKGEDAFFSGKIFIRLNLFMGVVVGSIILDRFLAALPL